MTEVGGPASRFDRTLVDGPIRAAVWRLAWPTMLQNAMGGLQGMVDHAMVGHYVGYTGNAAIGVSWQIFLVVIVFVSSLYTGMAVLVARFAGSNEPDKVNRVVLQAFLASIAIVLLVFAPVGYLAAPWLLDLVNAAPEVKVEALGYLRILFVFGVGMLLFFMLSGAFRAAGDARTPLRLGLVLTALNITLNVLLIRGAGPVPAFGTRGAAMGTVIASGVVVLWGLSLLLRDRAVIHLSRDLSWRPDWPIIRTLFRFGLPSGIQGVAMNVGGVLLLRFIGSLRHSAEAQAVYAVAYTELFSLITWTSVGLMGAAATMAGQNLGAGRPERTRQAVRDAAHVGLGVAAVIGALFVAVPHVLLAFFGMTEPIVVELGTELLRYLAVSGFFIAVALTYTGGLQGTGDTRSPLYISIVSQVIVPVGLCAVLQAWRGLEPPDIWRAIVLGHILRCTLSVLVFRRGRWQGIAVDIAPRRADLRRSS